MGFFSETFEKEILRQFDEWATTKCPKALEDAITDRCEHPTGALASTVKAEKVSKTLYHVGVTAKYGGWVNDGRGEVRPHGKYPLHWEDRGSGKDIYAYRSGPSKPRNFIAAAVANVG